MGERPHRHGRRVSSIRALATRPSLSGATTVERLQGMRTNDAYEPRYSLDEPPPPRLGVLQDVVDEMRRAAAFYGLADEDGAPDEDPRSAPTYDDAVARLLAFQERNARAGDD